LLVGEAERTVGNLIAAFDERSFAILFVLLLGVPALPSKKAAPPHLFDAILGRVQAAWLEYSADPATGGARSAATTTAG
jgi:hypothetical protein